jgi:hypothetical protein
MSGVRFLGVEVVLLPLLGHEACLAFSGRVGKRREAWRAFLRLVEQGSEAFSFLRLLGQGREALWAVLGLLDFLGVRKDLAVLALFFDVGHDAVLAGLGSFLATLVRTWDGSLP